MKKLILTTAITLVAFAGAFAQTTTPTAHVNPGPATANANLSVTINPIQSIKVNNGDVALSYSSTDHYKNGVTEERPDHLTVYSTGAFQVNVQASDLVSSGTETIAASGITVTAANGTTNGLASIESEGPVELPTTAASLIFSSNEGAVDRNVDVTYKGAGGDDYLNKYFKTGSNNVYKTVVTYSIEAK